jgi:acyl-CoA synthetase (NDP forming)
MVSKTIAEIDRMIHPKSISIIGASNKAGSFGRMFLEGVIRYGFEKIYPVHPRDTEMLGMKAYPSIKDIPYDVDLAILMTPPADTPRIVGECAQKGLKGVVIFTAGFGEKGPEGKKIEQDMARTAHQGGFRIIGPNSLGLHCPSSKLLMFPQGLMHGLSADSGSVGAFSHSGSFVDYLTYILGKKGIRFSKIVSCGNECDLNAVDFLEYLGQDDETRIIIAYMEGVKDGRRFFQLAREISKKKPIIVWKGGLTEGGAKAAFSHTGALAGSKHIWESMFKQAGIINIRSFESVVDCLYAFYYLALPRGRRIAVIAGQGGTVVGTADNCVDLGLELAKLSSVTTEKLVKRLPPVGTSATNPLDIGVAVLVDPNLYGESLKILDEDENVDMLLAITDPGRPCTQSIVEAAKSLKKPLAVTPFALPEIESAEYAFLAEHNIPIYPDARRAAFALSKLADYADYRANAAAK